MFLKRGIFRDKSFLFDSYSKVKEFY